jgi:phosphohistidine phosphatase
MDLYLIRHAEAVELDPAGSMEDFDRPLTENGKAQAAHLAKALPARGARIDRLIVSPLVRAVQTAEPLIAGWGLPTDAVIDCEELAPGGRRRKLAKLIGKQSAGAVGLVGHQPDLSEFAAWLIGSKDAQIKLDKAGVALVRIVGNELKKGTGELVWLLPQGWA